MATDNDKLITLTFPLSTWKKLLGVEPEKGLMEDLDEYTLNNLEEDMYGSGRDAV